MTDTPAMTPTSISLAERLRVKPLEWYDVTTPREDGPREPTGDIEAATEIGPYSVVIDTDEDVADYPWCCWTPTDSPGHFASQDEAKAAAQADYAARILSALDALNAREEAYREARPPMTMGRPSDLPEWEQVNKLFERHGMAAPDWRMRDELVTWLAWARYAEVLDQALALEPDK